MVTAVHELARTGRSATPPRHKHLIASLETGIKMALQVTRALSWQVQHRSSYTSKPCGKYAHTRSVQMHSIQSILSHMGPLEASSSGNSLVNSSSSVLSRRTSLVGTLLSLSTLPGLAQADEQVEVIADEQGFGQHAVRQGDLVMLHYIGSLADGQVFDSTRGGLKYRDGGLGILRPVVVRLSGYPQPGICLGLQQALEGMTIGGKRSVKVPAQLGFGKETVLAPYAVVPGGSTLRYDIEVLRVSSVGPDLLVKGISRCGAGGASATADNCANIEPAEFF